ncbi:MAG: hypothetical protein QM811_00050 [Pirellulales bacterium]
MPALLVACDGGPVPSADTLTIYSLKSTRGSALIEGPPPPGFELIQNQYPILGKYEVTDAAERRKIIVALNQAMLSASGPKKCFNPRHAFRIESGGKTIEYVVCFQCGNYEAKNTSPERGAIAGSAQPFFDDLLKNAGVPLNPGQGEAE